MKLGISEEQQMLRDTFARLFQNESSAERVRAVEATGFDQELWKQLVELGVPGMRVAESAGGTGSSLLDACLLANEAGRLLAPVPVIEVLLTSRLLADSAADAAQQQLQQQIKGEAIISLALAPVGQRKKQLVPAGAIANSVIALRGEDLVLLGSSSNPALASLGDDALAQCDLSADDGEVIVLDSGPDAVKRYQAAIEEWKLLRAAALVGLAQQSLQLAAEYSVEREAFDQPIGSYQGLAHPMADCATEVEGANGLVQKAVWAIANQTSDAAASVSIAWYWAAKVSHRAAAQALHVFGGYGLSLEYPIQLYQRRAKSWALLAGDPNEELDAIAERLWSNESEFALPDAGECELDFSYGAEGEQFAQQTRKFFADTLDDELKAHAHHSWEGHHPRFQKQLSEAGMLLPDWPKEYGGQGRNRYEMQAMAQVFNEHGWTRNAIAVTDMVGKAILDFGSDLAKQTILPRLTSGDAICCLGFSEPSCGSDVFAAQTRAEQEGSEWRINGQKMFTSGANIADYILLLTRTDPDVDKHAGLSMFIVPMDNKGISVQAVETLADERTNVTYYDDVIVHDDYRLGPANGGVMVMAKSLSNEQDGSWFAWDQQRMVNEAIDWARAERDDGSTPFDKPHVRQRLAQAAVHAAVSDVLCRYCLWNSAEKLKNRSVGPMSKLFASESYINDSADLLDLMAPDSLLGAADAKHHVEIDYRLSTATSIYAGSSEIMRSLIAENHLKMPRTRN